MIRSKMYALLPCPEVEFSLQTIGLPENTDDPEGLVMAMSVEARS
jgi:hypothetical protein